MKKLLSILLAAVLSFSAWSVVSLVRDVPVEEGSKTSQTASRTEDAETEEICEVYTETQGDLQSAAKSEKVSKEETATAEAAKETGAETAAQTEAAVEAEESVTKAAKKTWSREKYSSGEASTEAAQTEPVKEEETEPVFKENTQASYTVELNGTDTVFVPGPSSITKVDDDMSYVNDTILVFFNENVSAFQKYNAIRSVDGKFVGYLPIVDRYQVKVGRGSVEQLQEKCARLMENENVLYAASDIAVKNEPDAQIEPVVPDDPWYYSTSSTVSYVDGWDESNPAGSNWHLEAVQAPSAWAYNDYFHEIKVGIVDSGFDTGHEDLAGKISFPKNRFQRTNVGDNHGTHVSGIIGATANNGKGVTGLCWSSKFICVDWEPDEKQHWITDFRIYSGFINTVKAGAKVINFSLGCSGSFKSNVDKDPFKKIAMNTDARIYSLTMAKLLRRGYDFIVVQSAGNGSEDDYAIDAFYNGTFCPINSKNTMTCAGISKQDVIDRVIVAGSARNMGGGEFEQSYFSNGGSQVDICAPGSNIFSTVTMDDGGYSYMSGTSMAAPMVTGIVAMTWSVNPKLTGAQVRNIVCDPENTVYEVKDNKSEYHPLTDTYRMVNARLSVEAAIRLSRETGYLPPETTTEPETTTAAEESVVYDDNTNTQTSGDAAIDIGDEIIV